MTFPESFFKHTLNQIKAEGLYKDERTITTPQGVIIDTIEGGMVLNFWPTITLVYPIILNIDTAKTALDDHGFGMSSVRFICGTQDLHKNLKQKISEFFRTDDTILYTSCFDANGGLFETLLGPGTML
ncbi:MAG: hypothetical protein Ct9H300mP2_3620 [Candidatus Neomarinimicrobiota bacterium]|nr:MAG: hypothetical protein Ct9H300mP2_3620 [Candidatus Neomarinimicrobiota bacterium]